VRRQQRRSVHGLIRRSRRPRRDRYQGRYASAQERFHHHETNGSNSSVNINHVSPCSGRRSAPDRGCRQRRSRDQFRPSRRRATSDEQIAQTDRQLDAIEPRPREWTAGGKNGKGTRRIFVSNPPLQVNPSSICSRTESWRRRPAGQVSEGCWIWFSGKERHGCWATGGQGPLPLGRGIRRERRGAHPPTRVGSFRACGGLPPHSQSGSKLQHSTNAGQRLSQRRPRCVQARSMSLARGPSLIVSRHAEFHVAHLSPKWHTTPERRWLFAPLQNQALRPFQALPGWH